MKKRMSREKRQTDPDTNTDLDPDFEYDDHRGMMTPEELAAVKILDMGPSPQTKKSEKRETDDDYDSDFDWYDDHREYWDMMTPEELATERTRMGFERHDELLSNFDDRDPTEREKGELCPYILMDIDIHRALKRLEGKYDPIELDWNKVKAHRVQ